MNMRLMVGISVALGGIAPAPPAQADVVAGTASTLALASTANLAATGYYTRAGAGSLQVGAQLADGLDAVDAMSITVGTCTAANPTACAVFNPVTPVAGTVDVRTLTAAEKLAFNLVAVTKIKWSYDDESPKETVTFEYGGPLISFTADPTLYPAYAGYVLAVTTPGVTPGVPPPWGNCITDPTLCGKFTLVNAAGTVIDSGALVTLASTVPLPSSAWLLAGGALALGAAARPRRRD